MSLANSLWVSSRRIRLVRMLFAKASFISMNATSSGLRWRKSAADPTFQPAASSRSLFPFFIVLPVLNLFVVSLQSSFASFDDRGRCLLRLFGENLHNHNAISVDAIDDAPACALILYPQLVTPASNRGHRARLRQRKHL